MRYKKTIAAVLALLLLLISAHLLDVDDHPHYFWSDSVTSHSVKRDSIWLPHYHIKAEASRLEGIEKNASGITFVPARNSFFVVVNGPALLYEYDTDFNLLKHYSLNGFSDPEAVTYSGDDALVITDEGTQSIIRLPLAALDSTIDRKDLASISIPLDTTRNKGFEGVAIDTEQDVIYAGKEKSPKGVLAVSGFSESMHSISIWQPDYLKSINQYMDDLSDLYFDNQSGHLLVLSDESKLVMEVAPDGEAVSFMDLESGFSGLNESVPQAEGVTMDQNDNLLVVSEPNLLYIFEKKSR